MLLKGSDKQIQDLKDTYEAVTTSYDDIKDKKIIELAKQKRSLQLQVESLRTKAAKAAQLAVKFKEESKEQLAVDDTPKKGPAFGKTTAVMNETVQSQSGSGEEAVRKIKELEKKVVKLRQENSTLSA